MTSCDEGPEFRSIFRVEALLAKGEPPPIALAAHWPAVADVAVALCVVLLVAIPPLCWIKYAPEQLANGQWSRSDQGAVQARLQLPRHPRAAIRVGDPVDIRTCPVLGAKGPGRVVGIEDLTVAPQGSVQISVEVRLSVPVDATVNGDACTFTAHFRPTRTAWRDLGAIARLLSSIGLE